MLTKDGEPVSLYGRPTEDGTLYTHDINNADLSDAGEKEENENV